MSFNGNILIARTMITMKSYFEHEIWIAFIIFHVFFPIKLIEWNQRTLSNSFTLNFADCDECQVATNVNDFNLVFSSQEFMIQFRIPNWWHEFFEVSHKISSNRLLWIWVFFFVERTIITYCSHIFNKKKPKISTKFILYYKYMTWKCLR